MVVRVNGPLEERFWAKVAVAGPDDCWEWTACRHRFGYGRIGVEGRRTETAHRVSWRLHFGPIPEGLDVCHHCDNPPCVNPRHLFVGTAEDNMEDARRKGRASMPPHRRGVTASNVRLSEEDVLAIRERAARGESDTTLAEAFGVNRGTVYCIVKRRNWAWLG